MQSTTRPESSDDPMEVVNPLELALEAFESGLNQLRKTEIGYLINLAEDTLDSLRGIVIAPFPHGGEKETVLMESDETQSRSFLTEEGVFFFEEEDGPMTDPKWSDDNLTSTREGDFTLFDRGAEFDLDLLSDQMWWEC